MKGIDMYLKYYDKKSGVEILKDIPKVTLKHISGNENAISKVIKGENLEVLKFLITEGGLKGKIDMIYIDPPYSTNNIFTMSDSKANSISRSDSDNIAYEDSLVGPEYLEFLRERLVLLRELLSNNGSIYLHIDYKIGHYVKVLMDEIFGQNNFLSDISRIKCNPKNFKKKTYGNVKDMILFYSKTGNHIWNDPKAKLSKSDIINLFKKVDSDGRHYTTIPLHAPGETKNGSTGQEWRGIMPPKGRHWRSPPNVLEDLDKNGLIEWSKNNVPRRKIYADEVDGKRYQDILEFKDPQNPSYPTEKNIDLIKLLITASSKEDSIILDCFCGSGTTLKAAQELGRNWIGIDSSELAIETTLNRLKSKQKILSLNGQEFEYLEAE